jgi:hypothetical protein
MVGDLVDLMFVDTNSNGESWYRHSDSPIDKQLTSLCSLFDGQSDWINDRVLDI